MIGTILDIALELYKNSDKLKVAFSPKYLNYNSERLIELYQNEELVNKKIPYVEIANFIDNQINLEIISIDNDFVLSHHNNSIKTTQIEGLIEFKKTGKFSYDSNTTSLQNIEIKEEKIILTVNRSKYSDQVQSHLILDWENKNLKIIGNINLRGYLKGKFGENLPPFGTDLLSNSIGISCIIYFKKDKKLLPYLPFRNKSKFNKKTNEPALFEGVYHCSSSGVLDWNNNLKGIQGLKNEMYREIEEEIGLIKNDINEMKLLSLTRELLRAGKPQMFFVGFTNLTESQLIEKRKIAIRKSKDKKEKLEIRNLHISNTGNKILSLEAICNLFYAEKYIEKNYREQGL